MRQFFLRNDLHISFLVIRSKKSIPGTFKTRTVTKTELDLDSKRIAGGYS